MILALGHISRSRSRHDSHSRSHRDSHSRHESHDSRDERSSRDTLDQRRLFFRGVPYHIHEHDIEREFRRFVSIFRIPLVEGRD